MTFYLGESDAIKNRGNANQGLFGYSVVELLVIILIIGVLASIALPSFLFVLRRERANAVALSLYGWLNEVRQAATRVEGEGCQIRFNTGTFAVGGRIAEVVNVNCSSLLASPVFVNDGSASQERSVQFRSSATSVSYTPRTLTTNSSDITLTFVVGGDPPVRCLRIAAISGAIDVGRNDSSSSNSAVCSYSQSNSL